MNAIYGARLVPDAGERRRVAAAPDDRERARRRTVSRWRPGSMPRFVTLGLHRNVSLLAVAFLAVHVLTAVIDPDATVGAVAVVVPALSDRYGLWLGLAALALDLVVALVVTSLLRHRLAPRIWRAVHWRPTSLAGRAAARRRMGTDSSSAWMLAVDATCIAIFGGPSCCDC